MSKTHPLTMNKSQNDQLSDPRVDHQSISQSWLDIAQVADIRRISNKCEKPCMVILVFKKWLSSVRNTFPPVNLFLKPSLNYHHRQSSNIPVICFLNRCGGRRQNFQLFIETVPSLVLEDKRIKIIGGPSLVFLGKHANSEFKNNWGIWNFPRWWFDILKAQEWSTPRYIYDH